ncbi:hypothetical protein PR001_g2682 [Phytophthora rubi]|uniref:Jacalin-type lectin domain-containing protein n=1 Tax=Phytophthora rubi TaxID=129364 RepID=A0A6A3PCM2_9STRA|nr:hypothetical protein PR002_g2838 [Phytophthora rubi]KAE9050137.1 hypothetical protein PR001_g2682 [Phytophthora rubi]
MDIHSAKKGASTRVFYLTLDTSDGNSVSGGTTTENNSAPEGFQLSGIFGRAEGVDSDWYGDRIRNWVGPTISVATDSACYRKTESFDSHKVCLLGYVKDSSDCIT